MADEQTAAPATESAEPAGLDIDATVADIAASLMPGEDLEQPDKDESEAEITEKVEAKPTDPAAAPAPAPAADPTDVAPDTWKKEAKESWATVPPGIKAEIRRREDDFKAHYEQVKQPVAVAEKLQSILDPHMDMFRATNTDPWLNIQAMMDIQRGLMYGPPEQKLAIVEAFAKQAGVTFDGTKFQSAPDATVQYVRQLEARLNAMEGGVKHVTSTVQQAQLGELQESVRRFAEDTTAHPHFEEVADDITRLLRSKAAGDLETAYQMACNANPVVRQRILDAAVGARVEAAAKQSSEKVALAKKATAHRVRSTSTTGTPQLPSGKFDLDETLKEGLAEIRARH